MWSIIYIIKSLLWRDWITFTSTTTALLGYEERGERERGGGGGVCL